MQFLCLTMYFCRPKPNIVNSILSGMLMICIFLKDAANFRDTAHKVLSWKMWFSDFAVFWLWAADFYCSILSSLHVLRRPSLLSRMVHECWPKCGEAMWMGSKWMMVHSTHGMGHQMCGWHIKLCGPVNTCHAECLNSGESNSVYRY